MGYLPRKETEMSELFAGQMGSVTAAVGGKRWLILAIGMPSVNCGLACNFRVAGRPKRGEKT
jgi:hypothetical protein